MNAFFHYFSLGVKWMLNETVLHQGGKCSAPGHIVTVIWVCTKLLVAVLVVKLQKSVKISVQISISDISQLQPYLLSFSFSAFSLLASWAFSAIQRDTNSWLSSVVFLSFSSRAEKVICRASYSSFSVWFALSRSCQDNGSEGDDLLQWQCDCQ